MFLFSRAEMVIVVCMRPVVKRLRGYAYAYKHTWAHYDWVPRIVALQR